MNKADITAPVAIITGSSQRVGAQIAKVLHENGYKVVIHYHTSTNEAQKLVKEFNKIRPESATKVCADLADAASLKTIIEHAYKFGRRIDLLINNASVFSKTDLVQKITDWEQVFAINVKAPLLLSQEAFPYLAKSKGSIINITDIHSLKPLKGYSIYCMSKAALTAQTNALSIEFAPNVRVNAIAPGAVCWPSGQNELTRTQKANIISKTPLKKHGSPEYIAQAVLFLTQNRFITGEILKVDGGRSLT